MTRHTHDRDSTTVTYSLHRVTDPVCGMTVDTNTADTAEADGERFSFCSPGCKDEFLADLEKYAQQSTGHDHTARDQAEHDHAGHDRTGHGDPATGQPP